MDNPGLTFPWAIKQCEAVMDSQQSMDIILALPALPQPRPEAESRGRRVTRPRQEEEEEEKEEES